MNVLPTKPSALLQVALTDLKACEADDRYIITMGRWHGPDGPDGTCGVCMAGAVIAQTFGANSELGYRPSDFSTDNKNALYALNFFRAGCINAGLSTLNLPMIMGDREVIPYSDDRVAFHSEMDALVSDFKGLGI